MNTYLKASLPYTINGMNIPKVTGIIQFNNTEVTWTNTIRQKENYASCAYKYLYMHVHNQIKDKNALRSHNNEQPSPKQYLEETLPK